MPSHEKLSEFVAGCGSHITGDETGPAQIFLDRRCQAFDQPGCLDVGGTAFADYVWKPVVLVEMKKRGEKIERHREQAERYWLRLIPKRPRYVVLRNFDEFRAYDFDTNSDLPKDTVALTDLPQCRHE